MSKDKPRLGRGLASLLGAVTESADVRHTADEVDASVGKSLPSESLPAESHASSGHVASSRLISVARVEANPWQPRLQANPQALTELIDSIRQHGIIQPIVVRPKGQQYELIAGQRRLMAARQLEMAMIPAVIREADDQQVLEVSLIENIQREDLNCVDRALAYRQYQATFNFSSEQIAERLGQDRTTVTNYLRLLNLSSQVLDLLRADRLSMGHARALAGLDDPEEQTKLAFKIVQLGLSVRQTESLVSRLKSGKTTSGKAMEKNPNILDLEQQMGRSLSTKVQIVPARKKGTGKVVIEYFSLDDFDRILDRVCGSDREEL